MCKYESREKVWISKLYFDLRKPLVHPLLVISNHQQSLVEMSVNPSHNMYVDHQWWTTESWHHWWHPCIRCSWRFIPLTDYPSTTTRTPVNVTPSTSENSTQERNTSNDIMWPGRTGPGKWRCSGRGWEIRLQLGVCKISGLFFHDDDPHIHNEEYPSPPSVTF